MYGLFTYMQGEKLPLSKGNVGKFSLHGASGSSIDIIIFVCGEIKSFWSHHLSKPSSSLATKNSTQNPVSEWWSVVVE